MIRLSQAQLNLLETCPPQFQRLYLDQLGSPMSPEQQEKLSWGSQFHRLMQQQELGLPIASLLEFDEQLQHSIQALRSAVPELGQADAKIWREAEHCRTLSFSEEYLLTVIYDLLIADDKNAQILDWKTYLQPQNQDKLATHWQTRLYLYVLAETSDYKPEEISMTYWFVKLPTQPQSLTFIYSRQQHEETRQDLSYLLTQLRSWLDSYLQQEIPFPHRSTCQESCPHYPHFLTEQTALKLSEERTSQDWQTAIAEIEEVSI